MRYAILFLAAFSGIWAQPAAQRKAGQPPVVPKAEELALIRGKTEELEGILTALASKRIDPDLLTDVEVYAKAGRFLYQFRLRWIPVFARAASDYRRQSKRARLHRRRNE